ncbi:uncharacterized protein LOC124297059 isoform X2 [Neodiprion virginianus]|uniref:uncharacterized protein LOC124297059 isoform X2 n=1 Tax=Neodiprion virginianus TaxID=2961670 RepID=UPI001EE6D3E3|nr:uncharacterized protein LOC124297059 isoform X2 [Neodiprion virginianus]
MSYVNLLDYLESTTRSRNFIEGEQVVNANHLIYTGILSENEEQYELLSYCIQSSNTRGDPHEITTVISKTDKVISSVCSCTAGNSGTCKHSAGVLVFCTRNDLAGFKTVSSTDRKCLWSAPRNACLEQYNPKPLSEHGCFNIKKNHKELSDDVKKSIKEKLFSKNLKSALSEHATGRHAPLQQPTIETVPPENLQLIQRLISHSFSSSILLNLSEKPFRPLRECCQKLLEQLIGNPYNICLETQKFYSVWQKERQFRITGSRCYELYTYRKNLKPNWKNKSMKYFYPTNISTPAMKHGLKFEPVARETYQELNPSTNVFQCGLIISRDNPWLGYSPDGIIFDKDKPIKLLEIKCPYEGKSLPVNEVISKLNFIQTNPKDESILSLKKNHKYYGQIQFGMGILNIQKTDFIIFSSFDKSMKVLTVDFDKQFVNDLFTSLKLIYFNEMLHYACTDEHKQN